MNCPRCQKYIVPKFYCINCGYVPERCRVPIRIISLNLSPFEAHRTVRQEARPFASPFSE